jgi:GT2 family glycosyltransferase
LTDSGEITVIIPSWNRRELLRHCLRSLERQTVRPRVLVVDNGSDDGTTEMVASRFPEFACLALDANRGFAVAANRALDRVETPFAALLNNDTEADPGWVEAGLNALRDHGGHAFFASRMVNFFDRTVLDGAGDCYTRGGLALKRGFGEPVDRYSRAEEVLGASAGAAFYRMDLFRTIGGFDEDYVIYLEDVDLSLRAQLRGLRCLYIPEAVVHHMEAASDREWRGPVQTGRKRAHYSFDRVFWITRNRWQLMVTYQPARNLPRLVQGWTRSLLFHSIKVGHLGAFLRGLAAGMSMTGKARLKRRRMREQRILSDRQLCQLMQRFSPRV